MEWEDVDSSLMDHGDSMDLATTAAESGIIDPDFKLDISFSTHIVTINLYHICWFILIHVIYLSQYLEGRCQLQAFT